MSVPASRQLATVLRSQLGVVSDSPVVYPAATAGGAPADGYANVEIGGQVYTVPSLLGAFNRDPDTGEQVAGETAYLLVTHDSILAVGRPDLPDYELPPIYGGGGGTATPNLKVLERKVFNDIEPVTFGDGLFVFMIDDDLNGWRITDVRAFVSARSTSGKPTVQLRNITRGNLDLLTTPVTIDVGEDTSYTAAVPVVIGTDMVSGFPRNVVATAQLIAVDVDVAGAGTKGLGVSIDLQPPTP